MKDIVMADLTVIILTKNEEKNIEKCINSLRRIAKRIVVIDSFSSDNTLTLAKNLGAEVYTHEFENHAAQFNWGLENCDIKTEWIMKLDADEELTEELTLEIENKLPKVKKDVNGIILKRRIIFMGRWLKHGGLYPIKIMRIIRNGYGKSEDKVMDEHLIIMEGKAVTFENDFSDNNYKNLSWWTMKHNWYTDKNVMDYQKRKESQEYNNESVANTSSSFQAKVKRKIRTGFYYQLPLFFRAHLYYIYRYYFRLGFLDGKEGKIFNFLQAYWNLFLIDAKIYECEKYGKKINISGPMPE
jgi:glycosyltransferase involved in cell wall biosynthesis